MCTTYKSHATTFFLITENFYLCVSGKLLPNTKNTKKNFLLVLVYAFFTKLIKYNNASTVSCEDSKQNFEFKPKTEGYDGAFDHRESSDKRLTPDYGTFSNDKNTVSVNIDQETTSQIQTEKISQRSEVEEKRYKYYLCFGLLLIDHSFHLQISRAWLLNSFNFQFIFLKKIVARSLYIKSKLFWK